MAKVYMDKESKRKRKSVRKKGYTKTELLIIILSIAILYPLIYFFLGGFHKQPPAVLCRSYLKQLSSCMKIYAEENSGYYPDAGKWCDLLLPCTGGGAIYVCPAVKKGKCTYAMNPNCEPNSPHDVVLLFESKDGWNQFGGPELLTFENHRGKRCNILLNDTSIISINPEQIGELKWIDKWEERDKDVNSVEK